MDPRVHYFSRGGGFGLYLTEEGATLGFAQATLSMRLVGARQVRPRGVEQLAARSNYLVGADRANWKVGVENYARVAYDEPLPGVDLIFYDSPQGRLEYDLVLKAGVDVQGVEVRWDGAESLSVAPDGSLLLTLPGGGTLRQPAPLTYQLASNGAREIVTASYELRGSSVVGFRVGAFDRARPLVIDPSLLYSSYLGSSNYDEAFAVAVGPSGSAYLVGHTTGPLFPTQSPMQGTYAGGAADAFIIKLDLTGAGYVYSTYLGGNGSDFAYGVAVDIAGSAYVVGVTTSTNFPTLSPVQGTYGGMLDGFVSKLNPAGSALAYSTYLGGAQDDFVKGVAVSGAGKAHVVGITYSGNFPTVAALQPALAGTSDAFVSRFSVPGSTLEYSTFLGGSAGAGGGVDYGNAIALGTGDAAVVVGTTASTNFPTAAALQPAHGGGSFDAFVSMLSSTGGSLTFSTYLGGNFTDEAYGVAVGNNAPVVVGRTTSTNFPIAGAAQQTTRKGNSDAFISRYTPNGLALFHSTYFGGTALEQASAVAMDATGTAYVVGETTSTDEFPLLDSIAGQNAYNGGTKDAFFAAFFGTGLTAYSTYFGGEAEDRAVGVAAQPDGTTHIAGNTLSTDMPVFFPRYPSLLGSQDAFGVRLPGFPTSATAAPASTAWSVLLGAGMLLGLSLFLLPRRTAVAS